MRGIIRVCVMAVAVALAATAAQASLMHEDPAAMLAWQGTQHYQASDATYLLDVDVDYAVYAPGAYPGADPSGGTDYVYAYEIFNTVNAGSVEAGLLLVGLQQSSGARNIGLDVSSGAPGLAGGVTPDITYIGATGAGWSFSVDTVDYGEDSVTLILTSLNGPTWQYASVADGGLSAERELPSPLPEPATLLLLTSGAVLTYFTRRRR